MVSSQELYLEKVELVALKMNYSLKTILRLHDITWKLNSNNNASINSH